MQRAAKVDTNHSQIVSDLRAKGFSVRSVAQLKNFCDLIVTNGRKIALFEVKSNVKKIKPIPFHKREEFMTEGERRFAQDFQVWVVVDAEEIETIFNEYI